MIYYQLLTQITILHRFGTRENIELFLCILCVCHPPVSFSFPPFLRQYFCTTFTNSLLQKNNHLFVLKIILFENKLNFLSTETRIWCAHKAKLIISSISPIRSINRDNQSISFHKLSFYKTNYQGEAWFLQLLQNIWLGIGFCWQRKYSNKFTMPYRLK
jgi:hypothetical protein